MVAGALCLAVLALGVAGCGTAPERSSPVDAAASATEAHGTARIVMHGEAVDLPKYQCEGVVDYERHRSHARCEFGGPELELIGIDGLLYTRWYAAGEVFPEREGWTKETVPEDEPTPFEPTGLLGYLRVHAESSEELGGETVRGVVTTRYRLEVVADDERAVVDVWVDDQHLVRRMRFTDEQGGADEIEFYDFGVPVDVEAPPASEIDSGTGTLSQCSGAPTQPLRAAEVIAALREAGIVLEEDPSYCWDEGASVALINAGDRASRDGLIACELFERPGDGSERAELDGVETFVVANLRCSIVPDPFDGEGQSRRLEDALETLR